MSEGQERPLIVHVLHHLVTGGMENGLVNLVNHLPRSRWRHRVICIEDFSSFRNRIVRDDVEVMALHRSSVGARRMRQAMLDDFRRHSPSIVHTRNLSGLDALLPAWRAGVKVRVQSEHGWDVDDLQGRALRPIWLRRLHSPLVRRYLAVSKDIERYLTDRVGIAARRVSQIYNGVDTERFRPRSGARSPLLPPDLRGEDRIVIGTVGRLQAVKDQATLLRAVAQLLSTQPQLRASLRVAIVGGGPLKSELEQLSHDLGLDNLTWFSGPIDNVHEVLPSLDCFVLPSLMEGISNTMLEAMACGLPLLATTVGGNVELVRDPAYGLLFEPRDVSGLAEALRVLALQADRRVAMGTAARRMAVAEFSLAAMVDRYGRFYDALLGRAAGA